MKKMKMMAVMMGLCGSLMAQNTIETYSLFDINRQDGVEIADVTTLVEYLKQEVKDNPQVLDSYKLRNLLYGIDEALKANNDMLKANIEELSEMLRDSGIATDITHGYEAIDLGVTDENGNKVLWATTNVGAKNPWEPGDYFAWGETCPYYTEGYSQENPCEHWAKGKTEGYDWSSYRYSDGPNTVTKYTPSTVTVLENTDDAAKAILGGSWRMPTKSEFLLLKNRCEWRYVTSYMGHDVKGFIIYKKKGSSDNSDYSVDTDPHIFLPSAGYREKKDLRTKGRYWSSTLSSISTDASMLTFNQYSESISISSFFRYYGASIRPVYSVTKIDNQINEK